MPTLPTNPHYIGDSGHTTDHNTIVSALSSVGTFLIKPTSAVNGTVATNGSVSFTTQTSISLNGVFTSSYDNYLMTLEFSAAAASTPVKFRFRASGVDNSTAGQYLWGGLYTSYTGTATAGAQNGGTTATAGVAGYCNGSSLGGASVFLYVPKLTRLTRWNSMGGNASNDVFIYGGNTTVTTSYDGITILTDANVTGVVRIYGLLA